MNRTMARLRDLITVVSVTRLAIAALVAMGLTLVGSPGQTADQDLPNCCERKRDDMANDLQATDDDDDDAGGKSGGSGDTPTSPPTVPPTNPPTVPPTNPPTVPPTNPPTVPPTNPPEVAGEQAQVLDNELAVAVPTAVSAGVGTFSGFGSNDARDIGLGGGLVGVGLGLLVVAGARRRSQAKQWGDSGARTGRHRMS